VAWNRDSSRVVTAGEDKTARVWDVSWDACTLAYWRATVERSDYRLDRNGVLVVREPDAASARPSHASCESD
jgi:WD40 repeat protein